MTTRTLLIALAVSVLVLAGCARTSGRAVVGQSYYVYKNDKGVEVIGQKWQTAGSKPAVVTNDPADEEFWQFDARINDGMIYNVIGSKEKCEAARNSSARVASLTDPCKGPFYFKREK